MMITSSLLSRVDLEKKEKGLMLVKYTTLGLDGLMEKKIFFTRQSCSFSNSEVQIAGMRLF